MIAKGTIGTIATYGAGCVGGAYGAEIGTLFCPGIGTVIGGLIGGIVEGLLQDM